MNKNELAKAIYITLYGQDYFPQMKGLAEDEYERFRTSVIANIESTLPNFFLNPAMKNDTLDAISKVIQTEFGKILKSELKDRHCIHEESWLRLSELREDITDVDDAIKFLLDGYHSAGDLDSAIETVMQIFEDETNWKGFLKAYYRTDNYHSKIDPEILKREGLLRKRLYKFLDVFNELKVDNMDLTVEEIEETDETMEAILAVVDQETNWKSVWNQSEEEQTCMLNIEGRMRVRISDLLREQINKQST